MKKIIKRKKIFIVLIILSIINNVNAEEIKLGTYQIIYSNDESKILVENNGNIELGDENSIGEAAWDVYSNGSYYYIKSHDNNNLSIDISGAKKKNGTNIQTYSVNNTNAQKWNLSYAGNSYYYITSILGNYNLDVSGASVKLGTNIQLYKNNGTNAQKWKFKKIDNDENELEDGYYIIRCSNNINNVIDITGGKTKNNTNIQIYSNNYTWAQIWNLKYIDGYYTISSIIDDNKVVDISGSFFKKNTNIQLYESNNTDAQKFILNKNSDETYSIKSYDGLWIIDISGGSTKPETNIQLYQPNGTSAQKFTFEKIDISDIETGYYTIESVLAENKVIGVNNKALYNGKNVDLRTKTDYNYTKWFIKKIERDIYTIANADNTRLVLDVNGNEKKNKTNIQLYTFNSTDAQKWIIRKNSDGNYNLIGVGSQKALDINGANKDDGTNIQIYEPNNTDAQKFKIIPTEVSEYSKEFEDGKYIIKSSLESKKVLDITSANKANGTNVRFYNSNSTKAQIWNLEYDGDGEYIIRSLINPKLVLTADSYNVVSSKYIGANSQKWFFDKNGDKTTIINKENGRYLSNTDDNALLSDTLTGSNNLVLSEYTNTITYKGIDVSKHNGNISWEEVANYVDFAIIRAGYADETILSNGTDKYEDIKYTTNVEECEKYNIPYALYFYSYANKVNNSDRPNYNKTNGESAESEASHMINLMKKITDKGYYPTMKTSVYFDQEDDSIIDKTMDINILTGMINKFCNTMKSNNHNCGVYASKYWFNNRVNVLSIADKYSIWVAQWPGINNYNDALNTKTSYNTTPYKLWQFSSNGSIPGISGNVDLDIGYNIFD